MKLLVFLAFSLFLLVGCQSGMSKSEIQNMILENNEFINTVLVEQESDLSDLSIRISYIEDQVSNQSTGNLDKEIAEIKWCISGLSLEEIYPSEIFLGKWRCPNDWAREVYEQYPNGFK